MFQQFFLAEHQSVLDNVADGLLYAGVRLAERRERAENALRPGRPRGPRPGARPTQLSGGQSQRVAIARALVGQPAIVLADEPTGNLDQRDRSSILALLDELHAEGATIVVITHDRDIADRMPRRVEMLDGRIVRLTRCGPPGRGGTHAAPGASPTSSRSQGRASHDAHARRWRTCQAPSTCRPRPARCGRAAHPQASRRALRARASPSA